ncbi:hypothetical protein JCM15831A_08560 [Asaia astilbis]
MLAGKIKGGEEAHEAFLRRKRDCYLGQGNEEGWYRRNVPSKSVA